MTTYGNPTGEDITTYYVGSLYEETNGNARYHIFLGGMQIATISENEVTYYYRDHLGGTNITTDEDGNKKELIEYKPFGEFARQEKYGDSADVAWFYFTGKPKDDETGLYYYGARYYDPSLGRFITPDTIVQSPGGNPQTFNRYSYCGNNPVNFTDPTGHIFGFIVAAIVKAVTAAATYVAANAAAIATGALVGGAVGGVSSVAMGGNFWQGAAIGAIGGGVFAGLAPGLSILGDNLARGLTLGGAAGPLGPGGAAISNFTAGFLGGAASGAAVAGYTGADVGQGVLIGGAFAGGFSLIRDTSLWMRAKMVQQSRLDSRNASGKSIGFNNDGFKLGGGRFDPTHPNGNPSLLGGHQGGQGQIFGMPYSPGSVFDRIVEGYAGPHDFLNSWGYDQFGNLQYQAGFERVLGFTLNPLNVVIATPIAVPSAFPRVTYPDPGIVYGVQKLSQGDK